MADLKAKRRAGKLMELTGETFYDPATDTATHGEQYSALRSVLDNAARADGRIDYTQLDQGNLEDQLQQWENIPSLLRTILTPVIKQKVRSSFLPYSKEAVNKLIPEIQSYRSDVPNLYRRPATRTAIGNFLLGLEQRVPQIPTRVPQLIDQINQPSDIDKLGDLKNYLLQQMQQRR